MSESISIKRRKSTDNETSFDSLRSEAIELIQEISGKTWTDYNLHDPGITILEQLIYSLTDLIYRTEFAVEDYLAEEDGNINFELQALHAPVEIFPCRPTTEIDYRKILLNEINQIDNVWVNPVHGKECCSGLYQLIVKLRHDIDDVTCEEIKEDIAAVYHRNRNLCEDIHEIIFLKKFECQLYASIEVSNKRNPLEILAEIYFACAQCMSNSVPITNYDEIDKNAMSLEEMFTGPYTRHGYFSDSDLGKQRSEFSVSTLFSVINSIDSVRHINQIFLENNGTKYHEEIRFDNPNNAGKALNLLMPESANDVNVILTKNGRTQNITFEEMRSKINEIDSKYYTSRSRVQNLSLLYDTIKGKPAQPETYFSIQNQFPSNYGISALGLPGSANTDTKAKARQLKAYLVIFEQFLANFLANIDSIKTLFSIETQSKKSYSFKPLDALEINDLDAVYPKKADEIFPPIIEKFDHYLDRKSRLLDYLLALYGERFTQSSLKNFNFYSNKSEFEAVIVKNKVAYLDSIVELGRDRAAAGNYRAWKKRDRTYSGLQLRAGMLLGFEQPAIASLTTNLRQQNISLYRHGDETQLEESYWALRSIEPDEMDESRQEGFQSLPSQAPPLNLTLQELREKISESILLQGDRINDRLFRNGIYLDRYKIGRLDSHQDYHISFLISDHDRDEGRDNEYVNLGSYADKASAVTAAYYLRQYFLLLNKYSEGLHVVEHVLLRPGDSIADKDSFFSFRISVIFPAWSARCFDNQFRKLAEETVRLNAPAHIYPEFYWLDIDPMIEFESLYENWLKLKSNQPIDQIKLDASAHDLKEFLIEQGAEFMDEDEMINHG